MGKNGRKANRRTDKVTFEWLPSTSPAPGTEIQIQLKIHLYDFANKIKYSKITNVSCFKMAKGYMYT